MDWQPVGNSFDEIWNEKEQKVIEGIYVESQPIKTKKGDTIVYVLRVGDKFVGIFKSALLEKRFNACKIGDSVKIESKGLVVGKNGNEYKDYNFWKKPSEVEATQEELPTIQQDDEGEIPF